MSTRGYIVFVVLLVAIVLLFAWLSAGLTLLALNVRFQPKALVHGFSEL
jgi:hypothetical protein